MGPVSLEELTNPQHEAPAVGRYLRQYLAAAGGQHQLIVRFLDLVERLLTAQPGLQQARALLHVVGVVPQQLAPRYRVPLNWILLLIRGSIPTFLLPALKR